jgi:hypothetical protein
MSGFASMPAEQLARENLALAEQRREVRIVVSIPGRYSLADLRGARGERRVFACRAVNLSAQSIALAAPVNGKIGARVIADVLHLGRVEGAIVRVFDRGFAMSVRASDDERAKLADRIEWLAKHKDEQVPDQRADARFAPINPYSRLILPDGKVMICFVVDLSASGAAISAEIVPEVGAVLAIGKVIGRVVRHFEGRFSVKFVEEQSRESVEARVVWE